MIPVVHECLELEALRILRRFLERAVDRPFCRCASRLIDMVTRDLELVA